MACYTRSRGQATRDDKEQLRTISPANRCEPQLPQTHISCSGVRLSAPPYGAPSAAAATRHSAAAVSYASRAAVQSPVRLCRSAARARAAATRSGSGGGGVTRSWGYAHGIHVKREERREYGIRIRVKRKSYGRGTRGQRPRRRRGRGDQVLGIHANRKEREYGSGVGACRHSGYAGPRRM